VLNLHRKEKLLIALLSLSLLIGLGVSVYRKSSVRTDINIRTFSYVKEEMRLRVNINAAGADELAGLKGIGPVLAGRIIEYRSSNGPFASIEEIKNVKGVGPRLFDGIKDDITAE